MSLYDKIAKAGWKKGDYKINQPPQDWTEPKTEVAPKDLRDQLRREMEKIVEKEAEHISAESDKHSQEGRMKLAKFVKFREEKFGAVLFETRQEKVYTLNPTGAAVVREIVAGAGNIVENVKNRFQANGGNIEAEINDFLRDLKSKGLLAE